MSSRLIASIIFLSILFSDNEDSLIELRLDVVGQSNIILDEINPYRQSSYNIGAINFFLDHSIPSKSNRFYSDFINNEDTSKVVSQFIHNRGDYSFRETMVTVKNRVASGQYMLFKGHGRRYPGIYNNLGDDFVLQNFLIDYSSNMDDYNLQVSKYYHKEDINLPVSPYSDNRASEIYGTGVNFRSSNDQRIVSLEYSNYIASYNKNFNENVITFGAGEDIYSLRNLYYGIASHNFDFLYLSSISKAFQVYLNINHNDYSSDVNEVITSPALEGGVRPSIAEELSDGLDLSSAAIGAVYTLASKKTYNRINISLKKSIADYELYDSDLSEVFAYQFIYSKNKDNYWEVNFTKSYEVLPLLYPSTSSGINDNYFGEIFSFAYDSQNYNLVSISREYPFLGLSFSCYDVDLRRKNEYQSSSQLLGKGQMFEFSLSLDKKTKADNKDYKFTDMARININYNEYIDYSPIKNYLNADVEFEYLNKKWTDKYIPFFRFSFNSVVLDRSVRFFLNQGEAPILSSFDPIVFGGYNWEYDFTDIEIGLRFDNFEISYVFLHVGDEYSFPTNLSDITVPLYNMKYLNIKWQFSD